MLTSFFQSKEFGEFQDKIPYRGKTWLLKHHDQNLCLVIRQKMRFGKCFLWVPYLRVQGTGYWGLVLEDLRRIAKDENAIFARVEPAEGFDDKDIAELKKKWLIKPAKKRFTPEHTLILNLEKTEEELLAQMKPKGRYNINVARKNGVVVKQFNDKIPEKDFDAFYKILEKTGERDEFGIHPKSFYKTLLDTFVPKKMASLFLAYNKEGAVVAGIIVIFYGDTATYYYGASDYTHRNLMAPYALQWEAIREAKKRGMKYYDFLGIAPVTLSLSPFDSAHGDPELVEGSKGDRHPWAGVTDFKKKFGGREVSFPKAFDVVYKPVWYKAMVVAKRV